MVSTALHLNISGDARIAAHGCRIQDTLFEPVFSVAILTNYIKVRRRDAIVVTTENHPCGSIGLTFSSRAGAVISDDTGLCHEDRAIGVLQLNPIALSLRYVRICLPYLRYCASVPKATCLAAELPNFFYRKNPATTFMLACLLFIINLLLA
jgi:hypothetical protein